MNTLIGIFALLILVIAIVLWLSDSRIFLWLWYKLAYSQSKNPPFLFKEKDRLFPGSRLLESNWIHIRQELKEYLETDIRVPRFHEIDGAQKKISFDRGPAWRTLLLKAYGTWIDKNCERFPFTCGLLSQIENTPTVLFSILEPGVEIPPHTGKLKGIFRYHLALEVPDKGECFIRVGGQKYNWLPGEGVLFDDTYLHEVKNNSNQYRIVLFMDVKRPVPWYFGWVDRMCHALATSSPKFLRAKSLGNVKVEL